jgi:hypothetical protein
MGTRAKTNTILRTTAVMDRSNIAKNPGSAKFLIDRNERLFKSGAQNH